MAFWRHSARGIVDSVSEAVGCPTEDTPMVCAPSVVADVDLVDAVVVVDADNGVVVVRHKIKIENTGGNVQQRGMLRYRRVILVTSTRTATTATPSGLGHPG